MAEHTKGTTLQQMASSPAYFFSDYTATGGTSSCISASQPITGLNQIFQTIVTDLNTEVSQSWATGLTQP